MNDELEILKVELEKSTSNLEVQRKSYEQKLIEVENEKNDVIKKAYEEAENYLKEMQSKAKNLIDRISQDEVKKEEAKDAQKSLNMLRESFNVDKKQNVKEKKIVT